MMNLESKIEAVLFFKAEPVSQKRLADILEATPDEIKESLESLKENLKNRGIVLLEKENEVMLGTNPEISSLIEKLQKEELNRDLSKAALETLSIVLYKHGITRAEIDYIRGVNSSFTLRLLSARGLVERHLDPKDNRRFIYKPSFDLLSYMGVKSQNELPDFDEVNGTLQVSAENLAQEMKEEINEQRDQ